MIRRIHCPMVLCQKFLVIGANMKGVNVAKIYLIQSNTTKNVFNIKEHLNCGTNNVIYVINCTCGLQYVGRTTQPLRMRMNSHRFNTACQGTQPLNITAKSKISPLHLLNKFLVIREISITPCPNVRCFGSIRSILCLHMASMRH